METNIDAELMLKLNQKVKELIIMENIPLLKEFFQKYNIIFQPIDANNLTALHFAVQMSRKKSLLYLCSMMSPQGMNIPDIFGRTALHQAAAKGDPEIILTLIKFGANVNSQTISGETPLMKAIAFYQVEATKILLRFGADPNMINQVNGKSCLNQAYESRNNDNDIINFVKLYSDKYHDVIKLITKICNKDYPKKNYLQKLPDFLLKKMINFLTP
jgi:ankyrin repeat protein